MRTTLKIDDDLYQAAQSIAAVEHKSVGDVISALIRKALQHKDYHEGIDDAPSFRVSERASPLTPEMVREAGEDTNG